MKAFELKNKFHLSYATKILKQYGADFYKPKDEFRPYVCYNPIMKHFFLASSVSEDVDVQPISELNNFLEELGYSNKEFKSVLKEIDKLDMEAEVSRRSVGKRIDYDKY